MHIPSRLALTTLGDVLAGAHRAAFEGVIELEDGAGRHRVHLRRGAVVALESDRFARPLGALAGLGDDVLVPALDRAKGRAWRLGRSLVADGLLDPHTLDAVLDRQRLEVLEALDGLPDAELRLRPSRPLPPGAAELPPLPPRVAFHGRRRATARAGVHARRESTQRSVHVPLRDARSDALRVLGLPDDATAPTIRNRYRALVTSLHPDTGTGDTVALQRVVSAYRSLTTRG